MLNADVHSDQDKPESNCGIAPLGHGHGISCKQIIRMAALRLNFPHIFCPVVTALMPKRKMAVGIKTKKAREALSCGISIFRGKIPIAETATEPRTRLTMPARPSRPSDRKLFPRPMAKIKLSAPTRISPELNIWWAEPITPRTLKSLSVQLSQGD